MAERGRTFTFYTQNRKRVKKKRAPIIITNDHRNNAKFWSVDGYRYATNSASWSTSDSIALREAMLIRGAFPFPFTFPFTPIP